MNMDYGCCFVSCSTLAFNFAVSTFFNEFLGGRSQPEVSKVTVHQIFCCTYSVPQVSSQEQDYIFRQRATVSSGAYFFCKLKTVSKRLVSHCVDKVIRSMILQPF